MEAGQDHVLFTTDKELEDELVHGSLNLITDPTFDIHRNSRTWGTVLSTPRMLSDIVISGPVAPYTRMHHIVPEVMVGDKIYFHYNTLAYEDAEIARTNDDEPIYPVRYDQVYCSVRNIGTAFSKTNGDSIRHSQVTHHKIIPIGGWTLVLPLEYEPSKTIHEPNPPKYWPRIGQVAHIGTPLQDAIPAVPLEKGEFVLLRKNADRIMEIEGTEYYIVQQRNILGSGSQTLLKNIVKHE